MQRAAKIPKLINLSEVPIEKKDYSLQSIVLQFNSRKHWSLGSYTDCLLLPKLNKLSIWLNFFCRIQQSKLFSVGSLLDWDSLARENIFLLVDLQLPLTSQFTLLHHWDPRLGLAATQVHRHRVLDPGDGGRGLPAGLAHQHGVAALLHHLHAGVLDDGGEAGRYLFVWKDQRKWISRPVWDRWVPFMSWRKFFQFFNEKQNGLLFGVHPYCLTKVCSAFSRQFFV